MVIIKIYLEFVHTLDSNFFPRRAYKLFKYSGFQLTGAHCICLPFFER